MTYVMATDRRGIVVLLLAFGVGFFPIVVGACQARRNVGSDRNYSETDSSQGLIVGLSLDRTESYRGESVFFTVVLSHTFDVPANVASLRDTNRSLRMILTRSDGVSFTADQMSWFWRNGTYISEPRRPERVSLAPGERLELRGDLLEWFGAVPPGDYRVKAEYRDAFRVADTTAAVLRVHPAQIRTATVSACGQQSRDTPLAASWTLEHEEGYMVFYEQLSPKLPRNPLHCVRAAVVEGEVFPRAACVSAHEFLTGHVYWVDKGGSLYLTPAHVATGDVRAPVRVALPKQAEPVGWGLSLGDDSLMVPLFEQDSEELLLFQILRSGSTTLRRFNLDGFSALAPYRCFWGLNQQLHLAWFDQSDMKVRYALLSWKAEDKGVLDSISYDSSDPVIWLDVYLDKSLSQEELRTLYLGEGKAEPPNQHKPKVMLWSVSRRPNGLVCKRVHLKNGTCTQEIMLPAENSAEYSVVHTVVTAEHELSALLKDKGGRLYYGSTNCRTIVPLDKVAKPGITLDDHPCLVKGSPYPWVHLRYVSRGKAIEYIRLEPDDERDPIEKMSQERR